MFHNYFHWIRKAHSSDNTSLQVTSSCRENLFFPSSTVSYSGSALTPSFQYFSQISTFLWLNSFSFHLCVFLRDLVLFPCRNQLLYQDTFIFSVGLRREDAVSILSLIILAGTASTWNKSWKPKSDFVQCKVQFCFFFLGCTNRCIFFSKFVQEQERSCLFFTSPPLLSPLFII